MIPGYIYDQEIFLLQFEAARVPENGVIVEIGSYLGKSTTSLARTLKPSVVVYAVDTWDNRAMGREKPRDTYNDFLFNIKDFNGKIMPLRGESKEIGKSWKKTIDLLFIDGDHSYEAVLTDLTTWVPFLKPEGILLMHDYTEHNSQCDVRGAFEKYFSTHGHVVSTVIVSTLKVIL